MDETKDYPPYLDYPKSRRKKTNADLIREAPDEEHMYAIIKLLYKESCGYTSSDDGFVQLLKREVAQ